MPSSDTARIDLGVALPACVEATLASARRVCAGELTFFGKRWQYGPDWQWRRDPRSEYEWPLKHWTRVDCRRGGAKYVWEPNRHGHLITLAMAWYWSGDSTFSAELERQFRGWLAQNPPYFGINWTSGIELSIRLVAWCWALGFAASAPELTEDTKDQLLIAIALQARHVRRRLSRYSSANNHLIAEAAGLAIVGALFPDLSGADEWRQTGLSILSRELELQVHCDGVNREQAMRYHAGVLEWYLLVACIDSKTGGRSAIAWKPRLLAMAVFLERVSDSAGNVPLYGDSDDAVVAPLSDTNDDYFRSLRAVTATLYDDAAPLRGNDPSDERAYWLTGSLTVSDQPPVSPRHQGRFVFPDGGWTIHRAETDCSGPGQIQLAFNCGALGYGSLAAHGHADALSIWLSLGGLAMLIDPGTGAFDDNATVREYFRSTRAHNTIEVDGLDQSVQAGPTIWHRQARSVMDHGDLEPDVLARGCHDGYTRLRDPVSHHRSIAVAGEGAYIVVDRVLGRMTHDVSQYWHMMPDAHVHHTDGEWSVVERAGRTLRLYHWSDRDFRVRSVRGAVDPMLGWYSASYGASVPSSTVCLRWTARLPLTSVTVIDALSHDPISSVQVSKIGAMRIRIGLRRSERSAMVTNMVVPDSHPRSPQ